MKKIIDKKNILILLFIALCLCCFLVACRNNKPWYGTYYAGKDSYLEITNDCVRDEDGNENSYKINGNVLEIDGYTRNPCFYQDYNVLSFNVIFNFVYGKIQTKQGNFSQTVMLDRNTFINFNLDGTYKYNYAEDYRLCSSGKYKYNNTVLALEGSYLVSNNSYTTYCRVLDDGSGLDWGIYLKNPEEFFGDDESAKTYTEGLEYDLVGNSYTVVGFGDVTDKNIIIPSLYNEKEVTGISNSAFATCALTSISIPQTIKTIGANAFAGCQYLTHITIPHSVERLGENAFAGCKNLVSITIGNGVENIEQGVFLSCEKLTFVEMGNNVSSIGEAAFSGCNSLISINIPKGVTFIGDYAFSGCYKLVEVINKSSLNIVKGEQFENGAVGCFVKEIITNESDSNILYDGEYCFYFDDQKYYLLGNYGIDTELILPTQINGCYYDIYQYAFYNNKNITDVTIPYGVTKIDTEAFGYCLNLKNISIPETVRSIASTAFYGIDGLIEKENGIWYIDKWVVGCDSSLSTVELREGTLGVASSAFIFGDNITTITIPKSLKSFSEMISLEAGRVNYKGNLEEWASINFDGATSNPLYNSHNLYINDSLVTELDLTSFSKVSDYAFYNCTNISSIIIGNNVPEIGESSLYGCNIEFVKLPVWAINITTVPSVTVKNIEITAGTSIDTQTFSHCILLERVVLPKTITTIEEQAFENCHNLQTIFYKGTITDWNNIQIKDGNSKLETIESIIYYYSETEPELNAECTAYDGNYWHYVDGTPKKWVKIGG